MLRYRFSKCFRISQVRRKFLETIVSISLAILPLGDTLGYVRLGLG